MKRKIVIPFFVFLILFNSVRPAFAFGPAAGAVAAGGIEIGAGAYTAVLLGAGAVAAKLGYDEYGDQLKVEGLRVWNEAQQTIKDSFKASVDAAVAAGTYVVNLKKDVLDYFRTKNTSIVTSAVPPVVKESESVPTLTDVPVNVPSHSYGETVQKPIVVSTKYPIAFNYSNPSYYYATYDQVVHGCWTTSSCTPTTVPDSANKYVFYDTVDKVFFQVLSLNFMTMSLRMESVVPNIGQDLSLRREYKKYATNADFYADVSNFYPVEKAIALTGGRVQVVPYSKIEQIRAEQEARARAASTAAQTLSIPDNVVHEDGSADVVIPWDRFVPRTADDGTVAWDYPMPRVVELEGTKRVAIPVDDEGTLVEPWTGVEVADPAFPVDPPVPGVDIPPFTVPGQASLDFSPLLIAGQTLTTKFPFSIPWDLKRQLDVFNVAPTAPKFTVDYTFKIGSVTQHPKWSVDLSWMNPFAAFIRWILTIAIDIGFILLLRRLLPE